MELMILAEEGKVSGVPHTEDTLALRVLDVPPLPMLAALIGDDNHLWDVKC